MPKKVLIVDDEKAIVDILKFNLAREGYETVEAYDGEEGYNKVLTENPDLILLDVMLPNMPGFDVCRKVREKSNVPIIMLTARTEEIDKVLGLELGADDYITKPFGIREVMARVKANLRRNAIEPSNEEKKEDSVLRFGNLSIDKERYEATKNGKVLELTLREFELLKFLAVQPEKIFSRETLLEKVWGYEYLGDVRTVDVTVRRLREKIEDDASNPAYVMTKRGIGYYFNSKQKG
ncbi:MAG: response regulator transcription factor [Clostridia bacterium]|nr:response regulator transcription factor [Clostridia bacterium]